VFVLVALVPGCSRDPQRAATQFATNGDRYATAGRLKDAAIEYRNAIRQTPDAVELHAKLAAVSARTNDVQTVIRELVQIAELAPSDPAAQVQAGSVYLLAGRFSDARERAEAALRVKGDDATAHVLLGQALAGLHDAERSEASFREAVRLAPNAVEPRVALASHEAAGRGRPRKRKWARRCRPMPRIRRANRAMALLPATGRGARESTGRRSRRTRGRPPSSPIITFRAPIRRRRNGPSPSSGDRVFRNAAGAAVAVLYAGGETAAREEFTAALPPAFRPPAEGAPRRR
jgi:tetratricopeptide (TPR) repeat protein